MVGSTRADDILRDAEFLHLYKKAGFERFLMGMENTDEATLKLIRKGGATSTDREAIRLLRQHNILSMAAWVAGFSEQTDQTKWDYKHQVLAMTRMPPWRLFLWVKFIEAVVQLRPRALRRFLWNPDPKIRHAIRWYYRMGRRVWFHEMFGFFSGTRRS